MIFCKNLQRFSQVPRIPFIILFMSIIIFCCIPLTTAKTTKRPKKEPAKDNNPRVKPSQSVSTVGGSCGTNPTQYRSVLNQLAIGKRQDRDDISEICPRTPGSQPMLFHRQTQKCYPMGSAGPCPNNLYFYAIPFGSSYGECDCPQPGDVVGDGNQFPNIYHKGTDTCYPLYSRAFCGRNQWLIFKDSLTVQCEANPCANRALQNMVLYNGKCVSLGSHCGTGLYGLDKFVHFIPGNTKPSCDETQADATKLVNNLKCGKGQVLDEQGACQAIYAVL